MTEDFAISFASEELQMLHERRVPPDLEAVLLEDFDELGPLSELRVETGSTGYGAELMTLVVILTSAFLLGKQIDDGLAGWANAGKRLQRVMERLKKHGSAALSEPAALMVALAEMSSRDIPLDGIALVASHTLPVAKGVIPPELVKDFRHQPDRFYVFVLHSQDEETYLVCMRSSGEVDEIRHLPTGNWMEFIDKTSGSNED